MTEKLRFTGEWPPFRYWNEYPNWEFALDEEDVEGQDETTLRPAEVQNYIGNFVSHTVAEVRLADGTRLPSLLGVFSGRPEEVYGFISENEAWLIRFVPPEARWSVYVEDWLPEAERSPSISFDDERVFPMTIRSRLPRRLGEKPYHFIIHRDGSSEDLS